MGGFVRISAGSVGSAAANAGYITRPSAAEEEEELYHNAPEDVEGAETWEQTRIRLRSWADQVEAEEKARHGNRVGQPRTHYRGVISYEEKIETEAARADAQELLEEEFPEAQAVGVVHQDTDNTHVHIWMSARKMDGKKVHIDNQDMKDLHATFDQIYERRMQVPSRNAEKVEETRQFKRQYAKRREEAREKGNELFRELFPEAAMAADRMEEWRKLRRWADRNRPDRADPPGPEVYRQREERQHGKEIGQEVAANAEARADERRAKQASEQEEIIEDLRSRHEKRERARHEPRHEGRSSGNQRGVDRDAAAARRGERGADGAGEDRGDRGPERGEQRGHERSEEGSRGGERGSRGAERDGDVHGSDRGYERRGGSRGGSLDSGGGDKSDVSDPGGVDDSNTDWGDEMGAQQEDERESVVPEWEHSARWRAFDLLVGGERVEAARVLNDNPDKAEDIRAMLDDEQWAELWEGLRELERRKYGTNEAYKSLSTKQKRAVDQVQNAALLKGSAEGSLVQAWIRKAKETMSGLSEKEGNELGAAIPSEAEKVFESVKSGIESGRSQDQSQDEDQGQDQGRSRGGWGRGR